MENHIRTIVTLFLIPVYILAVAIYSLSRLLRALAYSILLYKFSAKSEFKKVFVFEYLEADE